MAIGLTLALAVAAAALAAGPPDSVRISYVIASDGRGMLIANPVPDGSWGSMTWQACPPDAPCQTAQPSPEQDRILNVGDAVAGTTFIATASDGSQSLSATSTSYRGPLRAVEQPAVGGSLRVGHVIKPVRGTWRGGWGGEKPVLQLQVCRTKRASSCKVIADSLVQLHACAGAGARIPRRYLGWYVRVANLEVGEDTVFADRAYERPESIPPLTASPTTAVATAGRVQPGRGPHRRC